MSALTAPKNTRRTKERQRFVPEQWKSPICFDGSARVRRKETATSIHRISGFIKVTSTRRLGESARQLWTLMVKVCQMKKPSRKIEMRHRPTRNRRVIFLQIVKRKEDSHQTTQRQLTDIA